MTNQLSQEDFPPADIIQAAEKVSRWFVEHNITDWKLSGCQSRNDDPLAAAAPELLQELRNIANADTAEWDDKSEFEVWAKSRARAIIVKATGTAP